MSELIITGYDAKGRPVYVEDLTEEEKTTAVESSPEWEKFSEKFVVNDTTLYLWKMAQIDKIGVDSSVDDSLKLLRDILRSGGIISLRTIKSETGKVLLDAGQYEFEIRLGEPEPVVEEPTPVHRGQQIWSEYRQFSESHSMQDCRNRAKVDAGFASFMRNNYLREARETESTQFPLAGQPSADNKPKVTPELISFAEEYRRTPTAEVRKRRNPVFNLSAEQYNKTFDAALAAGLI